MVPFWVFYGTSYLGYPRRDLKFDNYPYKSHGHLHNEDYIKQCNLLSQQDCPF